MVLPHACALEKEFDERVVVLMASGCSQLEAGRLANDDTSLDRFIALAPLCTYDELEPRRHLGAKTGTRLGTFPVPESLSFGIPQSWVDLRRISTTDVSHRCRTHAALASLSTLAQAHLQAALAKHWSYRDLSHDEELQRAFGQRITSIVPISTGKKMRVGAPPGAVRLHARARPADDLLANSESGRERASRPVRPASAGPRPRPNRNRQA
jgi:hypothetical protein